MGLFLLASLVSHDIENTYKLRPLHEPHPLVGSFVFFLSHGAQKVGAQLGDGFWASRPLPLSAKEKSTLL